MLARLLSRTSKILMSIQEIINYINREIIIIIIVYRAIADCINLILMNRPSYYFSFAKSTHYYYGSVVHGVVIML